MKFHPLEKAFFLIPEVIPFIVLQVNPEVLALYFVFNGINGMMQHANIDVHLGPLNWIFSSTELHRWHHSKEISESNTNYGNNLIIWDVIFGTRFLPEGDMQKEVGLLEDDYPRNYWSQFLQPFKRQA